MASPLHRFLGIVGRAALQSLTSRRPQERAGGAGGPAAHPSPAGPVRPAGPGPTGPGPTSSARRDAAAASSGVGVYDVAALGLPVFTYAPDPDGEADPGEVVWTWVPYEDDPARGKDRPVLVLSRSAGRLVVAQMTSKDHDRDAAQEARWGRLWHDVGSGAWDRQGRPSEVRLDRLLTIDPRSVRREGATMRRPVFDGVVAALRDHWT